MRSKPLSQREPQLPTANPPALLCRMLEQARPVRGSGKRRASWLQLHSKAAAQAATAFLNTYTAHVSAAEAMGAADAR